MINAMFTLRLQHQEIITSCNSLVAIQAGNACILNGVVAPLLALLQVQCEPHCWGCDWLPVVQLSLAWGSDWSLATSPGTVSGEGQATPVGYRAKELQLSFSVVDGFYDNVSHIPRLHKTSFSNTCTCPQRPFLFSGESHADGPSTSQWFKGSRLLVILTHLSRFAISQSGCSITVTGMQQEFFVCREQGSSTASHQPLSRWCTNPFCWCVAPIQKG